MTSFAKLHNLTRARRNLISKPRPATNAVKGLSTGAVFIASGLVLGLLIHAAGGNKK